MANLEQLLLTDVAKNLQEFYNTLQKDNILTVNTLFNQAKTIEMIILDYLDRLYHLDLPISDIGKILVQALNFAAMRYGKENGYKYMNISDKLKINDVLEGFSYTTKGDTPINELCKKYTDVSSLKKSLKQLKKTLISKGVKCTPEQEVLIRVGINDVNGNETINGSFCPSVAIYYLLRGIVSTIENYKC